MMSKLLPSQLTEEEILALLDSDDAEEQTVEIFNYKDDIVPFLSFYNITPGNTLVSKKLLYKLYKTYSKHPLEERSFNINVGQFVAPTGAHYNINLDNFAISNHLYKAEKTRDKTKSLKFQKHFEWFLTEKTVKRGTKWIEGFILFFIYKDFCKSRRVNHKLGYINFHKFLKLHFQYKRLRGNRALFFKIDENTFNIFSKDECDKIRKARSEKETRWSKKEASSGTEKVSS